MKTKDSTARTMRLAKCNALISALFYELTSQENYCFMEAYTFLGQFFGLNDCQIRRILRQKSKVVLSTANVTKFAVLLSSETARLSELAQQVEAACVSSSPHRMHFVGVRWGPR